MKRKSSFHYDRGNLGFCFHNDRTKPTANSIFSQENNEYSCSAQEAIEIYRQELQKRTQAYTKRTGKKLHKNTITHFSAIVNLDERHTLQDVQKIADYLEQTLGTKVFQIAIHKDEGYVDEETGETHINYHAHIEFLGLDEQGRSIRRKMDRKFLINIQTIVAEILQMPRGTNYTKERKKRPKRLGTYEYKQHAKKLAEALKQYDNAILNAYLQYKLQNAKDPRAYKDYILEKLAQKDESYIKELEAYKQYLMQTEPQEFTEPEDTLKAKVKDLKEENKKLREQLKKAHAAREHYAQLESFVKQLKEQIKAKELTIQQLQEQMQSMQHQLLTQLQGKEEELQQKDKQIEQLQQELQALQNAPKPQPKVIEKEKIVYREDTQKIAQLQEQLEEEKAKNAQFSLLLKQQEEEIRQLQQQLQELKQLRYRERKEREEEIKQLQQELKEAKEKYAKLQNSQNTATLEQQLGQLITKYVKLSNYVENTEVTNETAPKLAKVHEELDKIEEILRQQGISIAYNPPPQQKHQKKRNIGKGLSL